MARLKWATRLHPAEQRRTHPSEAAAYRHVLDQAVLYHNGVLRQDLNRISVFVDEGDGWTLHETVDLAGVAGVSKEN